MKSAYKSGIMLEEKMWNRFHKCVPPGKTICLSGERELFMRKSGILMHISSLPGPYGIGTMGKHAYEFVDFLQASGQAYWQILPLSPTGFGDSPYQAVSTFAGNH